MRQWISLSSRQGTKVTAGVFGLDPVPFVVNAFFFNESSISKNVCDAYPARKPRPLVVIVRFTAADPLPLIGAVAGL